MCCCKTCCKCERKEPDRYDIYYFVNADGRLVDSAWTNSPFDKDMQSFGNCFPTQEKAEEAARKIKELLKSL